MGNLIHALAVAPNNLWTVSTESQEGGSTISSGYWNGQTWTAPAVPFPFPPSGKRTEDGILTSVAARGPADVWAAGYYAYDEQTTSIWRMQNFITHWDGTRWATITSPNVPGVENILNGITAVPGGSLWAVGSTYATINDHQAIPNALILRYSPAVCRR
jgi:hypothetical protein